MDHRLLTLYYGSPAWLQTTIANALRFGQRPREYGGLFRRFMRLVMAAEEWTRDELEVWQFEQLQRVVNHAYTNVPAYRQLYQTHGVSPADLRSPSDLERFPTVSKALMRQEPSQFTVAHPRRYGPVRMHTSGTTGAPFQYWSDRLTEAAERALIERHRRRAGIPAGAFIASLGGRMVVAQRSAPPYWRWNFADRLVWLSAFHLTAPVLDEYVNLIRTKRIRFIKGYPSNLHVLARHLQHRGQRLSLESVVTGSEPLWPHVRELIQDRFGCPVHDWYGISERAVGASQCERRGPYHVHSEGCAVEVVRLGGQGQVREDDKSEVGELVGTCLWNYAMPLIRYRSGDLSRWAQECLCGRPHPVIEQIDTKSEDILQTSDGRYVSPSVLTHPFKPIKGIEESQIEQVSRNQLIVRVVCTTEFDSTQATVLQNGLLERLGSDMRVDVVRVERIPRGANEKFRWVISRVAGDVNERPVARKINEHRTAGPQGRK